MSYRKLEVDGETFEYVVGKTHVKIRGMGAFLLEEVGEPKTFYDETPTGKVIEYVQYFVKPKNVRDFIISRI